MSSYISRILNHFKKKEEKSINQELQEYAEKQADILNKKLEEMPDEYEGDKLLEKIDELMKICSK